MNRSFELDTWVEVTKKEWPSKLIKLEPGALPVKDYRSDGILKMFSDEREPEN
jgi:hypothetical protein